jgi:glycosyltransferase involved in cell wall biosynthesis
VSPLISVIVPIYGTEPYLHRCLQSILDQSLTDFEVLCVDDCSPDGAGNIARHFAERDGRVKVLKHEHNLGLSEARNTGLRYARATYVAGVDSDDYVRPNMLQRLWTATRNQTADVVECGFDQVSEDGEVIARFTPKPRWIDNCGHQLDVFSDLKNAFWNKLWRRSLFTDHGIEFPAGIYHEDLATTPRLLTHARSIRTIPDRLYSYVARRASITDQASAKHVLDYLSCYEILADFLRQRGLNSRYRASLERSLGANLHYYAGSVLASEMDEPSKERCIRQLLILKRGFIDSDSSLVGRTANDLRELLLAG